MRTVWAACYFTFLCAVVASGVALAQVNLPGTVQPGQIERRFQPPPPPRSTLAPIVPAVPAERLAPAAARKITLTLSSLQISGSTVYTEADLAPFYQPYLSKQITVATLYEIADAITTKYRNDGYILSRAFVPRQTIKDGRVRIGVIEGYVDNVRFEGRPHGRPELFQYYIDEIVNSRPLQLSVLERYLLLAGDLAGLNVRSVFEPSPDKSGAAALVVILTEKPVEAQLGLDNRGTKSLGPLELNLSGALNNALGLYERTALNVVLTPERVQDLQYYHLDHEETLNGEGTKFLSGFTYVRTDPGEILTPLDVQGRDTSFTLGISHPFIRSREQNLSSGLTFRYEDVTTDQLGIRTADDRIRSLDLNISYDFIDQWRGISQAILDLDHGLPFLGATPDSNPIPSRFAATTDFFKIAMHASRLQQLFYGFSVLSQVEGQYSPDSLVASEQFAFGGEPFGRGYDPAELTGDSGMAGSIELRYDPAIPVDFLSTAQFFTYYDAGEVFLHLHPAGPGSASATSAGLGVRLTPEPYLYASLEGDKPLSRIVAANGDKGWRVFFRIVARY